MSCMRVLDTTTFELKEAAYIEDFEKDGYAILSHCWISKTEIIYQTLPKHIKELRYGKRPLSSPAVDKIYGACETARKKGCKWMWIDTCCIDKSSTQETQESINSMLKWYKDARLCVTYLFDVKRNDDATGEKVFCSTLKENQLAKWVSRGWCVQELLAPKVVEFYDMNWEYLGERSDLSKPLSKLSGINERYLNGQDYSNACIAVKMSWMASRTTTRPEDIAYSLLGLLGVRMNVDYGEGASAFLRLQETVMKSSKMDESLFAWRMPNPNDEARYESAKGFDENEWGLLAASPRWFQESGDLRAPRSSRTFRLDQEQKAVRGPISRDMYNKKAKLVQAAGFFDFIGQPLAAITMNKRAENDFALRLDCMRADGQTAEIYLRPRTKDKISLTGNDMHKKPFIVCKRIQCDKIGFSEKPIKQGMGDGIVLQPTPG
ncbi:hypothetical protein F4860DRAFT_105828 [Xylaria cubensis]|nr:hypothetical protein F4860DRAFT_105828 [Xylaria cubensis]